jgi:hypothetical protein
LSAKALKERDGEKINDHSHQRPAAAVTVSESAEEQCFERTHRGVKEIVHTISFFETPKCCARVRKTTTKKSNASSTHPRIPEATANSQLLRRSWLARIALASGTNRR